VRTGVTVGESDRELQTGGESDDRVVGGLRQLRYDTGGNTECANSSRDLAGRENGRGRGRVSRRMFSDMIMKTMREM